MKNRPLHLAFSLVELSIVLVILGLLVGGVLSGQSLIRAAELRSVTTEHDRWRAAMNTFRDKYFATPGDFNQATSFWTSCAADPIDTSSCNGNADGRMNSFGAGSVGNEPLRFWQHLALAGLIEGQFTGFIGGAIGVENIIAGVNTPRARIKNGLWSATNDGLGVPMFGLGSIDNNDPDDHLAEEAFLKPEEAWNVDTKIDDGRPTSGKVHGGNGIDIGPCHNGTSYELVSSGIGCRMLFYW